MSYVVLSMCCLDDEAATACGLGRVCVLESVFSPYSRMQLGIFVVPCAAALCGVLRFVALRRAMQVGDLW